MVAHMQLERLTLHGVAKKLRAETRRIEERCDELDREIETLREVVSRQLEFPQTGQAHTKAQTCGDEQGQPKKQ